MHKLPANKSSLLLFFLLFTLATCISKHRPGVQQQPKTVVQRNRFFSQTSKNANYNITGVQKGRPLIYILKETMNMTRVVKEGLTIRFQGTPQPVNCPFTKITDLCVVADIPDQLKLIIECKNLPCQVEWVIYQPQPKEPTSRQPALNLYFLERTQHHLLGQITCNDPEVESLDTDITIYSQTQYTRAYHNNVLYVLFPSFANGYIYVDVAEQSRACSFIDFKNPPTAISKDQQIKDFIIKTSLSQFEFKEVPKGDFSIECSAIRLDKYSALKSVIGLTLKGWKGDKAEVMLSQKVKSVARAQANDFTYVFKAIDEDYTKLLLQFQVSDSQNYLINLRLVVSDVFSVDLGETVHFNLKKEQKLKLKIQADPDIPQHIEQYYFVEKRKGDIKVDINQCDPRLGCEIEVQALTDTDNMLYVSSNNDEATKIDQEGKGLFEFEEIEFIPLDKHFKHKIRLGDNIFLKKTVKKGKAYQIHVNSPNVLVYASGKSCQVPGPRCRLRTSNFHHPFIYEPREDEDLLLNVQGLENTEFQITVIEDSQLVELSDGTAFSYTMDEGEDRVDFRFKLEQKKDVTFNLVAPLNALKLFVANTIDSKKDLSNVEQSTDGVLQFKKEDIQALQFTVSVVKVISNEKYFSHFTLIASTNQSKQRLDPTVTNYEALSPSKSKDFIFQFDKNDDYILAFSLFNMKGKQVEMELKASKEDSWDKADPISIKKDIDFVDIRDLSKSLCLEEGALSCEIFVRITNKMAVQVDFSLTLLSRNAIIELKDGIWQSFPSSYMMSASHFYFYPRHGNNNILILYHSPLKTQLSYKLHRYDENRINPTQWPFPSIEASSSQSHHSVSIDKQQLNQLCWPNCVLLLTIDSDISQSTMPYSMYEYSFFKIMASNSQVQLPQKQKVSFTLNQNQDKEVLIDLKYLLDKDQITFYSSSTIGSCTIRANLYSQKQQICPVLNQGQDFVIVWGEYRLATAQIKSALKRKGMQQHNNIYLCAAIHSDTSCRMSLQYSSQEDGYKKVDIDTYEDIKLAAKQTKLYEVQSSVDQYSKITRLSGFPFIVLKKCQKPEELKQCKDDFKTQNDKGKQIVVKTQAFHQIACPGCVVLLKLSAEEPSALSFHSQSKFSSLELKQKVTLSDFLNENESNQYQIHSQKEQDLIINIHVQEGTVEVQVSDEGEVNLVKKSTQDQRIVQFYLKGKKTQNQRVQERNTVGLMNPLALSNSFTIYHITVKSDDSAKAGSYSIGYSSGKAEFYLQDGLIVDYQLEPKNPHTFSYCNQNVKQHVFYTLSANESQTLKDLKIKAYSMDSFEDEQRKEVSYTKPAMNKKTPNPTMLFDFPNATCFQIQLTNPTPKSTHVSMGINHQQVVFLPFGHQYPFYLHKGQYLNILSDVNIPGFIDLIVKKCDESNPNFKYTFDYDGFIKGEFMFESFLDETYTKNHVKANRVGTLYISIQGNPEQTTMFTLQLAYSEDKNKTQFVQPGKHGQITYTFIDSERATVSFAPVECHDCQNVKYQAISSENQEDLYKQMVCPNAFFGVVTAEASKPIHTESISVPKGQTEAEFVLTLQSGVSFVSVVGKLESGQEVYYKPIQISTIWGKWSQQTGTSHKIWISIIVVLILCCIAIWVRRLSRKGYRPLDELPQ